MTFAGFPFSGAPFSGDAAVGGGSPAYSILPNAGHTASAVLTINVTYSNGATAPASGAVPFSIASGAGSITAGTWVQDSSTTGHFTFVEGAVSGTPTAFHDTSGQSLADVNFSNAVVPPGAPTIGTLTDNGDGTVTVTFSAPADNGGASISNYTATSSSGGVDDVGASSPIVISAVNKGVSQTVKVTATNSAGAGAESSASNAVTPVTAPGAPTSVTVAASGILQAAVSFTAPADTGGSAILAYEVTSSPGGISNTGSSSPIVITGLSSGTAYTFTVRANNAQGYGVASSASSAITLYRVRAPAATKLFGVFLGALHNNVGTLGDGMYDGNFAQDWQAQIDAVVAAGLGNHVTFFGQIHDYYNMGAGPYMAVFTQILDAAKAARLYVSVYLGQGQRRDNVAYGVGPFTSAQIRTATVAMAAVAGTYGNVVFLVSGDEPIADETYGGTTALHAILAADYAAIRAVIPAALPLCCAPNGSGNNYGFGGGGSPWRIDATVGSGGTLTFAATRALFADVCDIWCDHPFEEMDAADSAALRAAYPGKELTAPSSVLSKDGDGDIVDKFEALFGLVTSGELRLIDFFIARDFDANTYGLFNSSNAERTVKTNAFRANISGADLYEPFIITPTLGHATGAIAITATGDGTHWTSSNPFSVTTGGAFASISNYVRISDTSATFNLNLSSLGGTVTITDSDSGETQNYAAAAVAPTKPLSAVITDLHNGTISVAFSAPADTGGAAISSYVATTSSGGFNNSGSASPIIISGINKGVSQHANVTATNGAGTGPSSDNSNSLTPVTLPGPPTSLIATATTLGHATVEFTAPADNGGAAITGYTVSPGTDTNAGETGLTHTIAGLSNAAAYTFTAVATNSFGTSVASAASNSITTKGFRLSPNAASTVGVKSITVTGFGTDWDENNPFAVESGPGTIDNYANVSGTSATFDLTISAVSGVSIVISDSSSGSTVSFAIGVSSGSGFISNVGRMMG